MSGLPTAAGPYPQRSRCWILLLALTLACCWCTMPDNAKETKTTSWICERDMPQSRNLIPILNRSILVTAGEGPAATYSIHWKLKEIQVKKGSFWPNYGKLARMGVPLLVPDGFPSIEPVVLGEPVPAVEKKDDDVLLSWTGITLAPGQAAAVYADVYLGPPDMYHTQSGLRFGEIVLDTRYEISVTPAAASTAQENKQKKKTAAFDCHMVFKNSGTDPVYDLEFAFVFPRALLDNETGMEIPVVEEFSYQLEGFTDPQPLDLLISDGLGRPAWGPRCTMKYDVIQAGQEVTCTFRARGVISDDETEIVIVPLLSIIARTAARYWPSAQIQITPPGKVEYSDYTHFNLVTADSRLFRINKTGAQVEYSSPVVLQYLGSGN